MPKIKTYKGAAKRFKVTGSGKILRRKQGRGHLRTHKSKRTLKSYKKDLLLDQVDQKRMRRILSLRIPRG